MKAVRSSAPEKTALLLVLHFHQPVGNFDYVVKRICDNCYAPFLKTISSYPGVMWNLHFSGSLLEWLERNMPGLIDIVRVMVKEGRAEIVGGAMYEPVLSVIPESDRIGQVRMMRGYLSSLFHTDPAGAWVPERVWEPHLTSSLKRSGIEYAILDDTHLLYAGMVKKETYGYFVTEDNGDTIKVFPSDKELRYTIPFRRPEETFDYLRKVASTKPGAVFTYADDVEKFGEWPGTHKIVYKQRWLDSFLKGLTENKDWLTTLKLSDCLKSKTPSGAVYIPAASYEEMLKWALPAAAGSSLQKIEDELRREGKAERYLPFVRGGFFRNFFAKYSEANQMHKRMLYVSRMLNGSTGPGISKEVKQAHKELYKGQCNCAYWHGLFGGLYLYHLRKATYDHVLKAEKLYLDSVKSGRRPHACEVTDFDADGHDEVIMQNGDLWLCVKPSSGGTVVELDARKISFNLINVMTRYIEFYHDNMTGMADIKGNKRRLSRPSSVSGEKTQKIPYDRRRRSMLSDHFLDPDVTWRDFEKDDYDEKDDFTGTPYDFKVDKSDSVLTMRKEGRAYGQKVRLIKEIAIKGGRLTVRYNIRNTGPGKADLLFATEIPFILPCADSGQYHYFMDGSRDNIDISGEMHGVTSLQIGDSGDALGLCLEASKIFSMWRFPITTFSRSEKGFEENYQGSVMVPNWRFSLRNGEYFRFVLSLTIQTLPVSYGTSRCKEEVLIRS